MTNGYIEWEIRCDKSEQGYRAYLHEPAPQRPRGLEMLPRFWPGATPEEAEAALKASLYGERIQRLCRQIGDDSIAMRAFLYFSISSASSYAHERPIYADIRSGLSRGHSSILNNAAKLLSSLGKLRDLEKTAIDRELLGSFKGMPENPLHTLEYLLSVLYFGGKVFVAGKEDPVAATYLPPEGVRTVKDRLNRDKVLYCHSDWQQWTGTVAALGADSRFMVAMEALLPELGIFKEDVRDYVTVSIDKYSRQTIK